MIRKSIKNSFSSSFFPILVVLISSSILHAQDDLLNSLTTSTDQEKTPVSATFKSTRILNTHSVESVSKNHLDFRIMHRFGTFGTNEKELWGLDAAKIRLSLEYGITEDLMLGLGRNNFGKKAFDGFLKYKILKQSTGAGSVPVTVSAFASIAQDLKSTLTNLSRLNRLYYTWQLLIAKKFNQNLSLQISPTLVHRNYAPLTGNANSMAGVFTGGRIKLTKRTSFNFEYFQNLTSKKDILKEGYQPMLSLGFDIETGGHVFQLLFTNNQGMIEKDFVLGPTGSFELKNFLFGFNISRTFSFAKKSSSKSW